MPIHNPCALLNRLLQEPAESAWLEFKVNNKDPREIGEYVSALANSAMLLSRDRAFLVFGIEDRTKRRVGTELRLQQLKQGNEDFTNWLARMVEPRVLIEVLDFECDGLAYSIVAIEPSYERPVRFSGVEFIRTCRVSRTRTCSLDSDWSKTFRNCGRIIECNGRRYIRDAGSRSDL